MAESFFFYDLETTGFDAREERIMQFAGQRTDLQLNPVGEPVDVLIKLTPDVLPNPDAIMITGITPQQTIAEGHTEAEFLKVFHRDVVQPGTTFVGFNNIRFDDEFMRFLNYRNFYDPYEWQWANGNSKWDMLDVVRMTRALRPDGIEWPFNDEGKPANRLELLTKLNGLDHEKAHDALDDVYATIAVASLIRSKQTDLFDYLYGMRGKKEVASLVEKNEPFAYVSGRFDSAFLSATAAVLLAPGSQPGSALVYNLREDPTPFLALSVDQLAEAWRYKKDRDSNEQRLPVKTLKYNHAPAVAPLGVIKNPETQERIGLSLDTVAHHLTVLRSDRGFADRVLQAVAKLDTEREQAKPTTLSPDARLYEKFISNQDKAVMSAVREALPDQLAEYVNKFSDERLQALLPLYKARNYPKNLSHDERAAWDEFCRLKLFDGGNNSRLAKYFQRLTDLIAKKPTTAQAFILEELQLYGQSIVPADASE